MENKCDVLILAGGLGTRLRSVTSLPKCMANINGKPFLDYVLTHLARQHVKKVFLSVGYQADVIENHYGKNFETVSIEYITEKEPLGTGGAIAYAARQIKSNQLVVLNGDTFFPLNLADLLQAHYDHKSDCSIALKRLKSFDRYGTVQLDQNSFITHFDEKKFVLDGYINAGIYVIETKVLLEKVSAEKFSLEKDFFERYVSQLRFYGYVSDPYFIDIGIPEDFARAQHELSNF